MKSQMKQFTGVFITLLIFLGVILLVKSLMFIGDPKTYGNTEEEIIKAVYKTDQVNRDEAVNIIDIIDMGTTRAAGFCTSFEKTGIIEFQKDKKGKFGYTYGEVQTGEVGHYVQWFNNVYPEKAPKPEEHSKEGYGIDKSAQIAFIVIGNGDEKYDVSLKVNDAYDFNGEIPLGTPTMLTFKMPEIPGAESYSFDLQVIDSEGNNRFEHNQSK